MLNIVHEKNIFQKNKKGIIISVISYFLFLNCCSCLIFYRIFLM